MFSYPNPLFPPLNIRYLVFSLMFSLYGLSGYILSGHSGLGYDSFRLWETMTLGTVAVLEKGTGLDKSVSVYVTCFLEI
ncbi:hypothetical protein B484DRAFT_31845 [Ochromonadaceae sp. CCMP2298]|nr:hypothetical protein B484DRAFT_31845 [Ochromonadaceae sp. CCMP2298]